MSIFSRLFHKEDEASGRPLETTSAPPSSPAPLPLPGMPAAQPEAVIGALADKTTPMLVIEAPVPEPPPKPAGNRDERPAPHSSDRTIVSAPPLPAERPAAERPPAPRRAAERTPAPVQPPPPPRRAAPRKPSAGTAAVDETLDRLFPTRDAPAPRTGRDGVSTAGDKAAVRATFEDLACVHVRPLRNMMIELRLCDSPAGWLDLARASIRSLRKMAEPLEMTALCQALDAFAQTLEGELGAAGPLSPEGKQRIGAAYEPLAAALPRAFALDGEHDRREPVLMAALLRQVPGLDPLMIRRLGEVGLGRLEALMRAAADEIAVVAEIPPPVAAALAAKVQELRGTAGAPGLDSAAARRALEGEVRAFEAAHLAFEKAATSWSADALAAKAKHRRQRELVFLRIVVALARGGEVDLARRLETLPCARRIEELDRCLREAASASSN